MKGIFEIHNNLPVIATEERPDETSFYYQANGAYLVHAEYYEAMKDWERQLIPIKNVNNSIPDIRPRAGYPCIYRNRGSGTYWFFEGRFPLRGKTITPGQAIEYNNGIITKTL